ncbi:MAG: HAMP domain-containing histidine kinase, partial [Candidatus Heimdallarchaeota archaeon]|nr:HAMP domain-containing histidine kinase [Candidatus Heimdallarchaeota archaeon]
QLEYLSKLVENLLLLAKKGEILGELSAVNLNELLEKIAKNISTVDPDLKITIRDLPLLNSDPTKLTQVFENILMNVLKHAKATKVEIYAEEDKKEHIIHIRDNGIGMTEKKLAEIRKSWKTRKYKSFGMLIVLKIVEAHNGKLFLTSKKGKGTTVSIHFPKK